MCPRDELVSLALNWVLLLLVCGGGAFVEHNQWFLYLFFVETFWFDTVCTLFPSRFFPRGFS